MGSLLGEYLCTLCARTTACDRRSDLYITLWLKWIVHFAVGILLLHHYKSDLVHLSDLFSLVIGIYK